jgi:preprotein translocase subunit YajC
MRRLALSEGILAVVLAASGSSGSFLPLLFIILIFGAMYFLFIRPQQRRNRELQAMQSRLGMGDEVMTGSGMYGTVTEIDETNGTVDIEISPEVVVTFARGAIARVVTPAVHDDQTTADTGDESDTETDDTDQPVIERRD